MSKFVALTKKASELFSFQYFRHFCTALCLNGVSLSFFGFSLITRPLRSFHKTGQAVRCKGYNHPIQLLSSISLQMKSAVHLKNIIIKFRETKKGLLFSAFNFIILCIFKCKTASNIDRITLLAFPGITAVCATYLLDISAGASNINYLHLIRSFLHRNTIRLALSLLDFLEVKF